MAEAAKRFIAKRLMVKSNQRETGGVLDTETNKVAIFTLEGDNDTLSDVIKLMEEGVLNWEWTPINKVVLRSNLVPEEASA